MRTGKLLLGLSVVGLLLIAGVMPTHAASRDAICRDPLLSRQEQSLCSDQMAAAQSVAEQKQIESKFRGRITKRKQK